MKIDPKNIPVEGRAITESNSTRSNKDVSTAGDFRLILDKTISDKTTNVKSMTTFDVNSVSSTAALAQIKTGRFDSFNKVEKLLGTMEMFKNALGNTGLDIRRVEGLLQEMVAESREAVATMPNLSIEDPLRDIISEAAVTVLTESQQYYHSYQ